MNVNYTISDPELRHKFYCLDPQCALRLCKQLAPGGAADAFRGVMARRVGYSSMGLRSSWFFGQSRRSEPFVSVLLKKRWLRLGGSPSLRRCSPVHTIVAVTRTCRNTETVLSTTTRSPRYPGRSIVCLPKALTSWPRQPCTGRAHAGSRS